MILQSKNVLNYNHGDFLGREGAGTRTAGRFYVAVVKAVPMFGSEMWVMTPRMEKFL